MIFKLYNNGVLTSYPIALTSDLAGKLDAPDSPGTVGQILGLNANLEPGWIDNEGSGISITDDNNGNVTIIPNDDITISDDNNGNVTIGGAASPSGASITIKRWTSADIGGGS